VLWSAQPGLVDGQGEVLNKGSFQHIALANPQLAPYGAAALEALAKLGLADRLRPGMKVLGVSARTGAGMTEYLDLLEAGLAAARGTAAAGGGR